MLGPGLRLRRAGVDEVTGSFNDECPPVNFRDVRAFVALAAQLGGSRVVDLKNVPPRMLSQIRRLERVIGVRLVVQDPSGVELTERGCALLNIARYLDACVERLVEEPVLSHESAGRFAKPGSRR